MGGIINRFYLFICGFLIVLVCLDVFVDSMIIFFTKSLFGLILFFTSLFRSKISESIVPIILLLGSLFINISGTGQLNLSGLWIGFREMDQMIVIVLVIPSVSIVLKQEPYLESVVIYGAKWIKTSIHFHFWLLIFTQSVSFFLLPTTAPIVYQFVNKLFGNEEKWNFIKITAIYRSVALAGIWVFSFPSFAYAVEALQVPLFLAMFHGLVLSSLGVLLSVLLIVRFVKRSNISFDVASFHENISKEFRSSINVKKNVLEFLLLFSSLLISILLVNIILPLSLLNIIPFVTIIWTILYFLIKGKMNIFNFEIKHYFKEGIQKKQKEINIFITAGILMISLETSGWAEILVNEIYQSTNDNLVFNILILLPLLITILGIIGIPPSGSIILIAGFVKNIPFSYSNETVLLSLTLGTVLSVLLSPLAVPSVLLSSVNGSRPWENSIQKNLYFALFFYVISEIYILGLKNIL
jgi:hypothetical protein